ncbi:metal ABC transporter ATP-binding protein [Caldibacillus thermolactis]|jgi:zinc transport system ATP-binding protein|uniref:Metal ABC transporter ATP-binding protein n=1 Tax=Pallidibacillus thermolactis TaxID=251051 RepID=A0ABT2WBF5_9BACI|nr:metal ABC transporter ATP-binding protein [Pallidibacillus thermolactis]MCU9592995.1 metal ABC transporter ATP-binding protein [Pallidibacillus thermolactis]
MKNKAPIIEIKNLYYRYANEDVLKNINLTIHKGEFLAILGPNGSGKSTLIKLMLKLLKKQKGEILLYGTPIEKYQAWEKIGFVPQKANAFNSGFPATVYEVVRSGLTKKTGMFRFFPKDVKQRVQEVLQAVDMEDLIHRNIGELSGGQQQRVFIARALIGEPDIIILDEPTVGIDRKRVDTFVHLLERLSKEKNITLVMVTHDLGTILDKASHIAWLNRTLHFHGPVQDFQNLDQTTIKSFYQTEFETLGEQMEEKY